jgi:hypothetical protein
MNGFPPIPNRDPDSIDEMFPSFEPDRLRPIPKGRTPKKCVLSSDQREKINAKRRAYKKEKRKADGRSESEKKYRREYKRKKRQANRALHGREPNSRGKDQKPCIGIDGEGVDAPCPKCADQDTCKHPRKHLYVYLCAASEHGRIVAETRYAPEGLTHEEMLAMLLSLPKHALKFGFSFGYDWTKIIQALPTVHRWALMRPEERRWQACRTCKGRRWRVPHDTCPHCGSKDLRSMSDRVVWNGHAYDFFNGRVTVSIVNEKQRYRDGKKTKEKRYTKSISIWDGFRFFQTSFINSLKLWKTGSPEQIARIDAMKRKRGKASFDDSPQAVMSYCQEECVLLAQMMRKLIVAHEEAGIKLRHFFGAGSSAGALLKKHDVASFRGPSLAELDLQHPGIAVAIMSAYFGGRFEQSAIGVFEEPVYTRDIASAYPYSLSTVCPCLVHGQWTHVTKNVLRTVRAHGRIGDAAVVKFRVGVLTQKQREALWWAPLPCRNDGGITFGLNFEGWVWRNEFFSAIEGWPDLPITPLEAYVYRSTCDCRPWSFLPEMYRERLRWGKEGKGIVMKLAMNACAGKTMQSKGDDPPFQSWPWAGLLTSNTRAQLNRAIAMDPPHVLGVATDAIIATRPFDPPSPVNTNTDGCPDENGVITHKALGSWERKEKPGEIPDGLFALRPGIYFKLRDEIKEALAKNPDLPDAELSKLTEDGVKEIRARGVGRRTLFEKKADLIRTFQQWDRTDWDVNVHLHDRRFHGAKTSILGVSFCGRGTCTKADGEPMSWVGGPAKCCPKCGFCGTKFDAEELAFEGTEEGDEPIVRYGNWLPMRTAMGFNPLPKREKRVEQGGTWARLYVRDLGGKVSEPYRGKTTAEGNAAARAREYGLEQPDHEESRFTDDADAGA